MVPRKENPVFRQRKKIWGVVFVYEITAHAVPDHDDYVTREL